MSSTTPCAWSATGYAFAGADGACTCRIAPPPGVALYDRELLALEYERDVLTAEVLEDEERLEELRESEPPEYVEAVASVEAKLAPSPSTPAQARTRAGAEDNAIRTRRKP